jgi:O-antigen ligase
VPLFPYSIDWLAIAIAIGIAFIIAGHSWWVPEYLRELAARHPIPHWRGRLGYGILAIIAIGFFPHPGSIDLGPTMLIVGGYLTWIVLSVLWTDDKLRCIKRVLQMGIVVVAAFSIASRFSFTECIALIAVSTGLFLALGVCEGLRTSFIDDETGRFFGGIAGPAKQGNNCVIFIFSTVFLISIDWLDIVLGAALAAGAVALLYLTKARAPVWAAFIGICGWMFLSLYSDPGQFPWVILAIPALFIPIGCVLYFVTIRWIRYTGEKPNPLRSLLHMGRDPNELFHMTGRTVIWHFVLDEIRGQWITGVGFGAFWNERRQIAYPQPWRPMSSHSAYVETLAETGVVGLALWMTILCLAIASSFILPSPHGPFAFAFVVFAAIHGVVEVAFNFGEYDTFALFLLIFGICAAV